MWLNHLPSPLRAALDSDRDVQRALQIPDSPDAPHGSARADGRGVNGPTEQTTVLLPEPVSDGNKTPPQVDADGPTKGGGEGTDTLSDPQTAMNNDEPPVTFPVISPRDYQTDAEFVNMYRYCKLALFLGPILQYCPYFCATECD